MRYLNKSKPTKQTESMYVYTLYSLLYLHWTHFIWSYLTSTM